ncbi:sensor histidine kinase [Thermogemmatispora sp.]|uniref:sensor histidine kinase n=1 Tax=Thermogemmatispora sp. TaxID=1968838 RepID=UPI0035E427D0
MAAEEPQPGPETLPLWPVERLSPYLIWSVWVAWVPLFLPIIFQKLLSHPGPLDAFASIAGVICFFSVYLWASWGDARYLASTPPTANPVEPRLLRAWLIMGLLSLLAIPLVLLNGGNSWFNLFYYISGYSGGRLPVRQTALAVAGLALLASLLALLAHNSLNVLGMTLLFIGIIGALISAVGHFVRTSQRLRSARLEIARLAATAERLRIARDLHDLLGHSLSLIALKSELAGRLLDQAPERAAQEIRDIEQVARFTLQEVREAVSAYRRPALLDELRAARELLEVAGVHYRFEGERALEAVRVPALEVVCSWIVREGVTNVIRHSRARECYIRFKQGGQMLWITIKNDGCGQSPQGGLPAAGNGLRGLAERVLELGGQFEAGPVSDGFRLEVALPLTKRRREPTEDPVSGGRGLEEARQRSERRTDVTGGPSDDTSPAG